MYARYSTANAEAKAEPLCTFSRSFSSDCRLRGSPRHHPGTESMRFEPGSWPDQNSRRLRAFFGQTLTRGQTSMPGELWRLQAAVTPPGSPATGIGGADWTFEAAKGIS